MGKARKNAKKDKNSQEKKQIFEFMKSSAKELYDEPDIIQMSCYWRGYGMKFIREKVDDDKEIFTIYACDEDERYLRNQPLCIGDVDEVVEYLNSSENVDEVMHAITEVK